jgi:hypothetical protein
MHTSNNRHAFLLFFPPIPSPYGEFGDITKGIYLANKHLRDVLLNME